jgi:integrase
MSKDNAFNFTKVAIDGIKLQEKPISYHDTKENGLVIMVLPSGVKTFYLYKKVENKPIRMKIGRYPDLSIENARKEAQRLKSDIALGKNPQTEKNKFTNANIFKDLFEMYIERYAKIHKKTWRYDEKEINRLCVPIMKLKIKNITNANIQDLQSKIAENNGKTMANRILQLLSVVFNKGMDWNIIEANPCKGIKKFREKSRDRFLQPDEIQRLIKVLNESSNELIRDYVYISLLTGARKSDVLSMEWNEIDFTNKKWRIPEQKNGESQTIPLTDFACDILQERKAKTFNQFVFGSKLGTKGYLVEPKKGYHTILKKAEITNLTLHDLRRTLGSLLASIGTSSHIISKTLGHKSSKATDIYARMNLDPVREAVEKATKVFKGR